jgi:hypothetical protein
LKVVVLVEGGGENLLWWEKVEEKICYGGRRWRRKFVMVDEGGHVREKEGKMREKFFLIFLWNLCKK